MDIVTKAFNEQIALHGFTLIAPDENDALRALVDEGWERCYREWFGDKFVDSLAPHHIEAIAWHWESRVAFLEDRKPDYLAYFPIWSRGHMKSSIAERLVVVDGMLSSAYNKPGYALYVARSKDKVEEHIKNIESLLSTELIRKWNPKLSNPKRSTTTNQQSKWTSTFLKSEANYSIQGGSLDSGLAGSRVEETRPSYIVADDIDGREDSPTIADGRLKQLTTEILPMRQGNTLVFFAQNLISRYSTMYRIWKGQARVLTNRKPGEPIPAVRDLVTREMTVDGIVKDIYVSGEITWDVWDAQRVQDEIDTEGLESFLRECCHLVDEVKEGQVFYNYDDNVHVISESEFNHKFGKDAWLTWRKKPGNDWARTKTDKHANVAGWWTISDVRTKLPNVHFLMYPMSFPANSSPEDVAERLLSCLNPYAYVTKDKKVTWSDLRKELLRNDNASAHVRNDSERMDYERGALSRVIPVYSQKLLQQCNVQQGDMSHEMDTVRKIYRSVYGLGFKGVNPRKHGGIEAINRELRVDYDQPHAFRPNTMGYTRLYIVAPDDLSRPYSVDGVQVYYPRPFPTSLKTETLEDSDLCRYHWKHWRIRPAQLTAAGETIDDPEKMYDDFGNMAQFAFVGNPLQGSSLTPEQKVDMLIPQSVKDDLKKGTMQAMLGYSWQKMVASNTIFKTEDSYDDDYE